MPDLGPHASFIWAAYGLTALAVGALAAFVLTDDRRQRALLAELERRGIRRRSASLPAAAPAAAVSKPSSKAAAPEKTSKAKSRRAAPRRAAAPRRKSRS